MSHDNLIPWSCPGSITPAAAVPAIIEAASDRARQRFVEFITANIRNSNTRAAYLVAIRKFCSWCDEHGIELHRVYV